MFREFLLSLLDKYVPATSAAPATPAVPQTIEAGRSISNVEAKVIIRNRLSDTRFKFRTLGALAKAIGYSQSLTVAVLASMPDVRQSRSNHRIAKGDELLYTFVDGDNSDNNDDDDDDND